MQTKDLIGKRITNIYVLYEPEVGGLDKAECFIELNNELIIDIPYPFNDDVWIKPLHKKAIAILDGPAQYPVYHINKERRSMQEVIDSRRKRERNIFFRLGRLLFGIQNITKEYIPYNTEYLENKLLQVKDKLITDIISYGDQYDKVFLALENGFIISETITAPHGTGMAGLNLFISMEDLVDRKGNELKKISVG